MSLWPFVIAAIAAVAVLFVASRHRDRKRPDDGADAGVVILEFGRAFPDEPVRDIILTVDGKSAFLRLADGKTGFMQSMGRHYITHLVPPGGVEVEPAGDRSLAVRFRESSFKGGTFVFAGAKEAAEVSVWLLDGFALAADESSRTAGQLPPVVVPGGRVSPAKH